MDALRDSHEMPDVHGGTYGFWSAFDELTDCRNVCGLHALRVLSDFAKKYIAGAASIRARSLAMTPASLQQCLAEVLRVLTSVRMHYWHPHRG